MAMKDYKLEPKEGYVETELSDGSRVLVKTKEQEEKELLLADNESLKAQTETLSNTIDTIMTVIIPSVMGM